MLVVVLEFIIALVIYVGGGALLWLFRGTTDFQTILALVSGSMGAVTAYWFQRRGTDNVINKMKNDSSGGGPDGQGS